MPAFKYKLYFPALLKTKPNQTLSPSQKPLSSHYFSFHFVCLVKNKSMKQIPWLNGDRRDLFLQFASNLNAVYDIQNLVNLFLWKLLNRRLFMSNKFWAVTFILLFDFLFSPLLWEGKLQMVWKSVFILVCSFFSKLWDVTSIWL